MAVISLKGLLMDKGGQSVHGWASQIVEDIHKTSTACERICASWQYGKARQQLPWVSLYVTSQYRSLKMNGPYEGEIRPVYLKWRALSPLREVHSGIKPGTQIDWVGAEDGSGYKPAAIALWAHLQRHHRELVPIVRQYDMASRRLQADMLALTGVLVALDQLQSVPWLFHADTERLYVRDLLKNHEVL